MRSPGTAEDEQESPCAAHRFGPEAEAAPSGRAVATQGRLRSASGQAARRIDSGRAADDVGEIIEGRSAGLCMSEQVMIDRHYGHLARDGREHTIRLLDGYADIKAADVQALDVRWTPQLPVVADKDNGNSA